MPPLEALEDFYEIDPNSPSGLSRIRATKGPNGKLGPVLSMGSDGYWRMKFDGEFYRTHRVVYYLHHRTDPWPLVVDHIDGDRLNNRIENLRACTQQQNCWNAKGKPNRSGLPKGISKMPNGFYKVSLPVKGSRLVFILENFKAAVNCLKSLRARHHGEYANAG